MKYGSKIIGTWEGNNCGLPWLIDDYGTLIAARRAKRHGWPFACWFVDAWLYDVVG